MTTTGIYLHFKNQTEAAFTYYQSVFDGDFEDGIGRFKDVPPQSDMPVLSEIDKELIMHVCLPILGGIKLMGSDAPDSMGFTLSPGNNVHISLHPDTRAETDRLFALLSDGGAVEQPLQEMFWGDYYGSCRDKFGVHWMFNCHEK